MKRLYNYCMPKRGSRLVSLATACALILSAVSVVNAQPAADNSADDLLTQMRIRRMLELAMLPIPEVSPLVTDQSPVLLIPGRHDAAAPQPSTQPTAQVQALVDQLSDASFAKREAATDALSAMGPDVAPQLRHALQQEQPPEASNRLQTLLKQSGESCDLGPSVITIHAKDALMRQVLEDFARQCGTNILVRGTAVIDQVNKSTISLDLDHASFWDALRQIEKTCSMAMTIGPHQLNLNPNQGPFIATQLGDVPGTAIGPFFIQPQRCDISRNLVYSVRQPHATGQFSLEFTATCEPKITLMNNQIVCSKVENLDERGHTLAAKDSQGVYSRGSAVRATWTEFFDEIPDMGTHLKTLRATMTLSIATAQQTVEITDLPHAAGQTRDLAGRTLQVTHVTGANGSLSVGLVLTTASPVAPAWSIRPADPMAAAVFLDESGRPLNAQNTGYIPDMSNGISKASWTAVLSTAQGMPTTLRYDIITNSRQIEIPIELHDIELPVTSAP